MYTRKDRIFAETELRELIDENHDRLKSRIDNELEDYILNVNENEYINYLTNSFLLNEIDLTTDEKFITTEEREFREDDYRQAVICKRLVVTYHVPFRGDVRLLGCRPSEGLVWSTDVTIEDNCICFELVSDGDSPNELRNKAEEIVIRMKQQVQNLNREVKTYNSSLEAIVRNWFLGRKQEFLKKNDFLAALKVPIKKRENLPKTFSVPTAQSLKRVEIKRPEVTEIGYKADPTLDQPVYFEILQTIFDVGKQFERLPSTYTNKSEEELRDHFLLYLEPRFEGSATGETFNKAGKTDILIRFNGTNVFIAECKFWKGVKSFLETITQLLRYLAWRDSKAAVILFVPNKDFTSVINDVENVASNHPNYLGFIDKSNETWINYRFHINDDPSREVKLAILLFHIPKLK